MAELYPLTGKKWMGHLTVGLAILIDAWEHTAKADNFFNERKIRIGE